MSDPYATTATAALKPEDRFSKRLSKVLKGISCPISTGGSLELQSAPTLQTKSGGVFTIAPVLEDTNDGTGDSARVKRLNRQVESLQDLIKDIPQASFGAGSETKLDASVRDALQLPAEKFEFNCIPPKEMEQILATVKQDLALETDIVAEPYSLNVYQRGGQFVKHKDTPRGSDMIGTLVVCLPSLFTGGCLSVTMGSEKHTYFAREKYAWSQDERSGHLNWWKEAGKGGKQLIWAAFFADVDHEIQTVHRGLRMTVSFLIRRQDTLNASSFLPREIQAEEQPLVIREELGRALGEKDFLGDGGKLGYPCLHLYTNTEVFPGGKTSEDALTPKQISHLKGRDLMVANAAVVFGLGVFLVPYLSHSEQGDECDFRLQKFPKRRKCPSHMCIDDIKSFFAGERDSEYDYPDNHADIWLLQYVNSEHQEKPVGGTANFSYDGYYGNEASCTTFYVKSALFIKVPSFTDTRGDEATPSKTRKIT